MSEITEARQAALIAIVGHLQTWRVSPARRDLAGTPRAARIADQVMLKIVGQILATSGDFLALPADDERPEHERN